jgi:nicotinamidase-related amidase
MTQPKTLLEMAGASPAPVPLAEAAVLVIDAQREYLDGKLALPGIRPALAEVRRLVALARGRGRPVIHVRHVGRPGGLFDPTGPGEAVVEKKLPNAFAGTDLDARLRGLGVNKLIVVGFMTHMCVSSTVRAALDFGYSCTVVAGGCATRDLPDGAGGAVPAAVLHRAELAALADRFATVVRDCDGLALGAAA